MTVMGDDVCRATVEMHYESLGAIQNVYHLRNEGTFLTEALALADIIEILENLMGVLAAMIAVLQVVDGVRVINVTQMNDVGFGAFVDTTPFTGVGQVLPSQVAGGVSLITDRLGIVGRKYWGAPVIGMCSDAELIAAASLVIMGNAAEDMTELQVATTSSWRFGIVASLDAAFLPFTSYALPTTAIIQRRRRSGVGI